MLLTPNVQTICAFVIVSLYVLRTDPAKYAPSYVTNDGYCTSGDQNGRQRCWQDANSSCWNPQSDGRLAIDDSPESHDLIRQVVRDANITEAWIGGFTSPLYWHWMATPEKNISSPIYFQGCYLTDDFQEVATVDVSSAEEECILECLTADPNTRFFGLHGVELSMCRRPTPESECCNSLRTVRCYCGRKLIVSNANPSECMSCRQLSKSCNNPYGKSESYIAAYSINTSRKCNDWWREHPRLLSGRCSLYINVSNTELYLSWDCQEVGSVYCYKKRYTQGPHTTSAAVSGTTKDQETTPSHVTQPRTEGPTTRSRLTEPRTEGTTAPSHATEPRIEGTTTPSLATQPRTEGTSTMIPETQSTGTTKPGSSQEAASTIITEKQSARTTRPTAHHTETSLGTLGSTAIDVATTGKEMQTLTVVQRETTQKFSSKAVTSEAKTSPKETTPGVTVGKTRSEVTHSTTTATPRPSSTAPQTTTKTPVVKPRARYNPPQLTPAIVVVTIFALFLIPSLVSWWINRQRRT